MQHSKIENTCFQQVFSMVNPGKNIYLVLANGRFSITFLFLFSLLMNWSNLPGQSCAIMPVNATGNIDVADCNNSIQDSIKSGDVLSIDLQEGKTYIFKACYNNAYSYPATNTAQLQLWSSSNIFIKEAIGLSEGCATLEYTSCTNQTVLLQAFSHLCSQDWKKWDLEIETKCCEISCKDDIHLAAERNDCTAQAFSVIYPDNNGLCDESTVSYTTTLPVPPLPIPAPITPTQIDIPAGNPVGCYEVLWTIQDCAGGTFSCEQEICIDPILACNDLVNINLIGDETKVTLDMLTEAVKPSCYDDYKLEIFANGESIGTSISCDHLGQAISFTVSHISTGHSCSGEINAEDKQAPILECQDHTIKCSGNSDPEELSYPEIIENCDNNPSLTYYDSYEDYNCDVSGLIGQITRFWTVTDAQGNEGQCEQYINIQIATLVGVSLPQDTMIDCNKDSYNPEITGSPQFMDMNIEGYCNIIQYFEDDTTYHCPGNFKILRNWFVLDWCTNESMDDTQIIEVIDTIPPILECPIDFTLGTDSESQCTSTVSFENISASDACSGIESIIPSWEFGEGNGPFFDIPVGEHIVSYIATDSCGNSSTCEFQLTIIDDDKPIVICDQFTEISIPSIGEANLCADDLDSGSYDNCGIVNQEVALMEDDTFKDCISFDCTDAGNVFMVIMQSTDANGMKNQCMVEVTVVDKVPPSINCPEDLILDCEVDFTDLNITSMATAFDSCLDTIYYSDDIDLNDCRTGTIIRTWFAEDTFGNISSCEQNLTLTDDSPPNITFGRDTVLFCEGIDEEYGMPIIDENCALFSTGFKDDILLDDPCVQKILRTWTVINECTQEEISQSVLVKLFNDEEPPTFTGAPTEITASCEDPIPDFIPPFISDDCDEDLEIEISEGEGSRLECDNSSLIMVWIATDDCGNSGKFTQTINIIDETPPLIVGTPANLTLSCEDEVPFEEPSVTDNCDQDIVLVFTSNETDMGCPQNVRIERTWTATDNCGNTAQSMQVITISDSEAPIFTFFPEDIQLDCLIEIPDSNPTVSDNCDSAPILQMNEEIIAGDCDEDRDIVRTFTVTDACGNSTVRIHMIRVRDELGPTPDLDSFDPNPTIECDDSLPIAAPDFFDNCNRDFAVRITIDSVGNDCERVITRTFTATDNCGNTGLAIQVINSFDTTAPTILVRPPFLIESDTIDCIKFIEVIDIVYSDNCDENVDVYFEIDYHIDDIIYDAGIPFEDKRVDGVNASGFYPIGKHQITYYGTDDCGLLTTAVLDLIIEDRKLPFVGCVSNGFIIGTDGTVEVDINEVVNQDATLDECTPIIIEFATDFTGDTLLGTNLTFDCDDIGQNLVWIVAIDSFDNVAACINQIFITDDNDVCGNRPEMGLIIAGKIATEDNNTMSNIEVNLGMDQQDKIFTDENGLYYFQNLENGNTCSIEAKYDDLQLYGVTTYDMVLIQQHIIGASKLDSPYKMIAADINNNGEITTLDLVQLRQLILYQITSFPNNTSWRFVDEKFKFTNSEDPFQDNFSTEHYCHNMQSSEYNVNFIAIKTGDVNNSALLFSGSNNSEGRSFDSFVKLQLENSKIKKGKTYRQSLNIESSEQLESIQFTLAFDESTDIKLVDLNSIQTKCVNLDKKNGLLHFAWTTFDGELAELLQLEISSNKKMNLFDGLKFSTEHIQALAFNNGGEAIEMVLENVQNNVSTTDAITANLQVNQNEPNPFATETTIPFNLLEDDDITFEVYDINGKMIYKKADGFSKGKNEIKFLSGSQISGLYYYKLQSSNTEITKKMMIMKN